MNKGFTLMELLVVVLILGILASAALPQYQLAVYKARFNKIRPFMNSLARAQEVYYMANGAYAQDVQDLDVSVPSDCVYTKHPDYAYDVLDCPDVTINIARDGGGTLTGLVKKCPVFKPGCVTYNVPYSVANRNNLFLWGTEPSCAVSLAGGVTDQAREYGKKVCLSLGGVEKTVHMGTAYVL